MASPKRKREVDAEDVPRLLKRIAHDLRNPVAAVVTNLDFARRVLEEGEVAVDPNLMEAITDSSAACVVLRRVLNNLDLLLQNNWRAQSVQALPLLPVCEKVLVDSLARAEQSGISIRLMADAEGKALRAMFDSRCLGLALDNIVDNAIQHTPRGGSIEMHVAKVGNEAHVEVRDQGTALAPDAVEAALTVEAHLEAATSTSRYSRGLGLLAARLATKSAGGTLYVESDGVHFTSRIIVIAI